MTKQDILDYFSLIDFAYNESGRLESLSRMLDELLKEQEHKDRMFHALEDDWKRLKELLKEQEAVVRCKDCKHFDTGIDEDGKKFYKCIGSVKAYGGTEPDWFCADGERKSD